MPYHTLLQSHETTNGITGKLPILRMITELQVRMCDYVPLCLFYEVLAPLKSESLSNSNDSVFVSYVQM